MSKVCPQLKKNCAVFTIVKNEKYFLPVWLKHYKRYFDNSDIYVLDHQSNDGSTEGLDVNVELVINEVAFDHEWLLDTVKNFQVRLLEDYQSVLFAEIDEIIYTLDKPLNEVIIDFINDDDLLVQSCISRDLIQNLKTEKPLGEGDLIFKNRNYWFQDGNYHKTLLSKIPLEWVTGFHHITNHSRDDTFNLRMCHLHRFDFELMYKRNVDRINNTKVDLTSEGNQNKITNKDQLMLFFIKELYKKELIPEDHKIALEHI
jgi:hypothetical protein